MSGTTDFMVDVENTKRSLLTGSMYWLGAVRVDRGLATTFEGKMCPTTDEHEEAAMISGVTWDEIQDWPDPATVMPKFVGWLIKNTIPGTNVRLWSDNTSHDYMWIKFYLEQFSHLGSEIIGHSARNIQDQFRGIRAGLQTAKSPLITSYPRNFSDLKITPHNHTPVDDAKGNVEAAITLHDHWGLKINVLP